MVNHLCSLIIPCVDHVIKSTDFLIADLPAYLSCKFSQAADAGWQVCIALNGLSPKANNIINRDFSKSSFSPYSPESACSRSLPNRAALSLNSENRKLSSAFPWKVGICHSNVPSLVTGVFQRSSHVIIWPNLRTYCLRSKTKWLTRRSVFFNPLTKLISRITQFPYRSFQLIKTTLVFSLVSQPYAAPLHILTEYVSYERSQTSFVTITFRPVMHPVYYYDIQIICIN